jgi:hypothetical protein
VPSIRSNRRFAPLNAIYNYIPGGLEMVLHGVAIPGTYFTVSLKIVLALDTTEAIPEPVAHGLALTQTCRQIYAETRSLTFQLKAF